MQGVLAISEQRTESASLGPLYSINVASRSVLGTSSIARSSVDLLLVFPVSEVMLILSRRETGRVYLPFPECKLGSGPYTFCVNDKKSLNRVEFAYNIGMKPSVGTKLPRLPATKVHD